MKLNTQVAKKQKNYYKMINTHYIKNQQQQQQQKR